jgi:putative oxidoreductase
MKVAQNSISLGVDNNNSGGNRMKFLDNLAPHVHWLIRLSLAATFILHGIPKIPPDNFVQMSGLPVIVAWAVGLGEIAAGIALIVGKFTDERLTRLGGLLVVVIMIGAIVLVHAKNGWMVGNRGMEFQALMLAAGMLFLTKGNKV